MADSCCFEKALPEWILTGMSAEEAISKCSSLKTREQ